MGPKPIQDVTPPLQATSPVAEPPSGPEIVGDIPVRAQSQPATTPQEPVESKNPDSSFIVSDNHPEAKKPGKQLPVADKKDTGKPKDNKPKPTLAIVVAVLAIICLAAGAYLLFINSR